MMKRTITIFLIVLVTFGLLASTSTSEFSVDKAKRVDQTLKRIAKRNRNTPFLRKITFSQDALNSYLNIFYTKRYAPEVKYIKLNLEKNNFASGVMKIKLKGEKYDNVPSFLRDIEVEFNGKVECDRYQMRYLFDKIKINGNSFSPELLDEAFGAAQINARVKKSMFDWFDLMPGIKKVIISYQKITIFY